MDFDKNNSAVDYDFFVDFSKVKCQLIKGLQDTSVKFNLQ